MSDHDNPSRHRAVPSGRLSRLAGFGRLAGGVAGSVLGEGARRIAAGERPRLDELVLTPANARRLTDRLAHLRGAAMKLGQMISMDAGDMLPPELSQILSSLRDQANFMPPQQLDKVLASEWGKDWRTRFRRFEPRPIAAASIGQVHRALTREGELLAIKVQYPGVAQSIDSDVDNVATLLKVSGLLPKELDYFELLKAAKEQLHEEADYVREGEQMRLFKARLADRAEFIVPTLHEGLTTDRILAMSFEEGAPIESLESEPQDLRNHVFEQLIRLVARELFEFGVMQTDPNFANYRWQPESGRIVLLDFGAARAVPERTVASYRRLMLAGLAQDHDALRDALIEIGFVSPVTLQRHRPALDGMIDILMAHLGKPGLFDFADRSFVDRVRAHAETIIADKAAWHVPPADTLFVQRKVSGTALLAIRMQARLPLLEMVAAKVGAGD